MNPRIFVLIRLWRGRAWLFGIMIQSMEYLLHTSFIICVLGVLVIVFGITNGLVRLLRYKLLAVWGMTVNVERKQLGYFLGYYLLLGLEFSLAANIIDA